MYVKEDAQAWLGIWVRPWRVRLRLMASLGSARLSSIKCARVGSAVGVGVAGVAGVVSEVSVVGAAIRAASVAGAAGAASAASTVSS